jgi:hypothetical protein
MLHSQLVHCVFFSVLRDLWDESCVVHASKVLLLLHGFSQCLEHAQDFGVSGVTNHDLVLECCSIVEDLDNAAWIDLDPLR